MLIERDMEAAARPNTPLQSELLLIECEREAGALRCVFFENLSKLECITEE